jgi:hypothetical protein
MADKQISQLTEVSTPATTDVYVCQQSNTAKKITLNALRNWILKIAGLSYAVTTNLTGNEYMLLDQNSTAKKITLDAFMNTRLTTNTTINDGDYFMIHASNYPRKVTASTIKAYCASSSGSGAFYAVYGSTSFADVVTAYNNGKALWCRYGSATYAPLIEVSFNLDSSIAHVQFVDPVERKIYTIDSYNWSEGSYT